MSKRDNNRRRYYSLLEQGLCTKCGKNPHILDRTLCEVCREIHITVQRKKYQSDKENPIRMEHRRKYDREFHRKRSKAAIDVGLCSRCRTNKIDVGGLCLDCSNERKETYNLYKSMRICVSCRVNSASPTNVLCLTCSKKQHIRSITRWERIKTNQVSHDKHKQYVREYIRERNNYREEQLLCKKCGKQLSENDIINRFKNCMSCRIKARKYNKKDIGDTKLSPHTRVNLGLCYYCENPVMDGTTKKGSPLKLCEYHYNLLPRVRKDQGGTLIDTKR